MKTNNLLIVLLSALVFFGCEGEVGPQGPAGADGTNGNPGTDGTNGANGASGLDVILAGQDLEAVTFTSVTPAMVQAGANAPAGMGITPLFSSEDQLPLTPNFVFGGSADGAAFLDSDGQLEYFVNNEDNYAVAKVVFNSSMTPVAAEYVLNSTGAGTRLCSGSLVDPAVHGFGPLFLTAGESGIESQIQAIDINTAENSSAGIPRPVPGLGRWNSENAITLPTAAGFGGTTIIIGDDHSSGNFGQLVLYRSSRVGDLVQGNIYVLKRVNGDSVETNMIEGTPYDVEFVEIPDHTVLTGAQLDQASSDSSAIEFGRVEDVDYRKGNAANNREVWFAVTGDNTPNYSVSGRVYQLVLDENIFNSSDANFLRGTLTCVIDGDAAGNGSQFHNPDNIMMTENYAYIQEDPNGYNRTGGSVLNGGDHPAYIYQYDIVNNTIGVVLQTREGTDFAPYTDVSDALGSWEYGSMLDITDVIGATTNTFILAIQPHTWRDEAFAGADGGAIRPNENQGSQIVLITGLPR